MEETRSEKYEKARNSLPEELFAFRNLRPAATFPPLLPGQTPETIRKTT